MINKTQAVKEYLEEVGSITTWEAITRFRATRLSAIIFNLRNVYGMNIVSQEMTGNDNTRYVKYVLVKE